ncbi:MULTISPECIES: hypothetical protein [Vibrio]|uniref:hypothetical protein n=1 Tax=Vibrio TaxID=662 RepID=UPI0001B945DE|nr:MULTISPECIES: hypothetical protein [Vibrio]EEX34083.1 conserved hypothetical protein [Vibrio coralliilyticus ATCC BAA-450]MDE3899896.1 hypothetical protein [Vibrio sp. CC007]
MLFPIEYVETNMVYLNEVFKHFIQKASVMTQYRKASLFPTEFIDVHDDSRNDIDKKFKAVFEQIKSLNPSQKKQLKRMYINHQRTKRLCQDRVAIVDFSAYPEQFKKSLKSLGEYLYSSGLKNTRIQQLAIAKYGDNNSTLYDHWLAFKEVNGSVCCFCGIQDYEEQLPDTSIKKWRPAYDHYLPKEKYPFSAVNFRNLIPCCYQCNSKSKGAFDPCNCKKTGRKKAKYPFSNDIVVGLKFKFVAENVAMKTPWVVELNDENDEVHQTWNRVYQIKDRVASRLNSNYVTWLRIICPDCIGATDIAAKKVTLTEKAIELASNAKEQRESIHQANLMATLALTQDELLGSILQTIEPDPQPESTQAGVALLNSMGFSLAS